jgi:putative heme degradation protein
MSGALTFVKQSKKMGLMSNLRAAPQPQHSPEYGEARELQAERKRNYEHDLKEEMAIAEANEVSGLP